MSPKKIKIPNQMLFLVVDSFLTDLQLERIEQAFKNTRIKHLSLPPSIREIESKFESIYVMNELYASNKKQTAIFRKDGNELICVIPSLEDFKIPEGVRVNRKNVVIQSRQIIIPAFIEIVEKNAFFCYDGIIEFEPGPKLRSLDFEAFSCRLESPTSTARTSSRVILESSCLSIL